MKLAHTHTPGPAPEMAASRVSALMDADPAKVYASLMLSQPGTRWCFSIYSHRCERRAGAACPYLHVDDATALPADMRCMTLRHVHVLCRDLTAAVAAVVEREMMTTTTPAGGKLPKCGPYQKVVAALRSLGWVIPERPAAVWAGDCLERAPFAPDVAAIVSLTARTLHHDVRGAPPVMLRTVLWAYRVWLGDDDDDDDAMASFGSMPSLLDLSGLDDEAESLCGESVSGVWDHHPPSSNGSWATA
eukprot:TRINITY_DN2519_c0_g1_i1.p1 TRINITY_DN2519_c0_g1~~TRINITY_DN2519_c0_g1_i1.p1  ORF type:complete len:246 (+),score=54.71 TRINITY_DN2519_c0_g1_i1:99-836(+)